MYYVSGINTLKAADFYYISGLLRLCAVITSPSVTDGLTEFETLSKKIIKAFS